MHDSLKKICKGLEKEFDEYAQHMSDGKLQMHEKDVERLKNLGMAMASLKLLKMLEGMKEDGEQQNGHGVGQFMDQIKKQGMGGMMNAIGIPTIPGITGNQYPEHAYNRRGVPGTGRTRYEYDEYDNWDEDDTEMRRGVPGSGRRRRRSRAEYDGDNANMAYNDGRSGQGGNTGGQSGNSGGNGGR